MAPLLWRPPDSLLDRHVALSEIAPRAVAGFAARVAEARSDGERFAAVGALLHERQRAFDARVHHAATLLDLRRRGFTRGFGG